MIKKAFTLVELIFVIVIIGVLSAFAVPKFANLTDNAKITAEVATASAVQTTIDTVHAKWLTSRCDFTWGVRKLDSATTLNAQGYPISLGATLENVVKNANDWSCSDSGRDGSSCKGPASGSNGAKKCKTNKPCKTKKWVYDATNGAFELKN